MRFILKDFDSVPFSVEVPEDDSDDSEEEEERR